MLQDLYPERVPLLTDPTPCHTPTTKGTPAGPDVEANNTQRTHAGHIVEEADNIVHPRASDQTLYKSYGVGEEVEPIEMEGSNEVGGDVAGTHFSPHKRTAYHSSSIAEKSNVKSRGEDNHNHSMETMRHLD